MTDHKGFTGTFTALKHIKTRAVYRVEIEVPEEMIDAVLERMGGLPRSGTDRHVAVIPINFEKQTGEENGL